MYIRLIWHRTLQLQKSLIESVHAEELFIVVFQIECTTSLVNVYGLL